MKSNPSFPLSSYPPSPSAMPVEDFSSERSSLWSAAFFVASVGIFTVYSRLFDVVATGLNIPRLILSLVVLSFFVSGKALVFLRSSVGKLFVAFLAWVTLTVVTSIWKVGSMEDYYLLLQSSLFFLIAASLPVLVQDVKKLMTTLAFAGLLAALLSFHWGLLREARLSLEDGIYADPNEYAMCLVMVVPFIWALVGTTQSYFVKILGWSSLLPIFFVISRAGSRGAMLGFAAMILVLFIISAARTRVLIVGAVVVGLVGVVAVMPDYIRTRYLTFFDVDSKTTEEMDNPVGPDGKASDLSHLRGDTASASERRELLLASIDITFKYPFFGVGPGNFPTAARAAGAKTQWQLTHNCYTQISSETGIPGLILFVSMLLAGFNCLISVLRQARPTGSKPDAAAYALAKCLLLSTTALSVSIFFLAVGYECMVYLWVGMAASLWRTFSAQKAVQQTEAEEPASIKAPDRLVFAPAFAKERNPLPQRERPAVEGRPVRFNRFR